MKQPRKMTPDEKAWVRRLQALMNDAPPGVHLLTQGYHELQVIDAALADGDLHDGIASRRGAVLTGVSTPFPVHGVSG